MPFDGTQPALLEPTLENLVKLLRDRSSWPEGFEFSFHTCWTCAMGLAFRYWGWDRNHLDIPGRRCNPNPGTMAERFNISESDSHKLFWQGEYKYLEPARWNPEIIASEIETYLANKTARNT